MGSWGRTSKATTPFRPSARLRVVLDGFGPFIPDQETGVELGKSHVLLSLAELELDGNDPDAARARLEEARALAERSNESGTLSKAHELFGRVAQSIGDVATADREFVRAISILEQARLQEPLVVWQPTLRSSKKGVTQRARSPI